MNKTPQVILASASIGRKGLLEKLGIQFEVIPSTIDEDIIIHQNLIKMIQMRALAKAEDVARKLSNNQIIQSSNAYSLVSSAYFIIAADSMAIGNNPLSRKASKDYSKAYGKVKNNKEAHQMVRELMGKTHEFVTATSIRLVENKNITKKWDKKNSTLVTLREMSDSEIEQYLGRYDFTRFAACYTFNETPWDWITKIDGSFTNVIGLPFEVLLPILREVKLL